MRESEPTGNPAWPRSWKSRPYLLAFQALGALGLRRGAIDLSSGVVRTVIDGKPASPAASIGFQPLAPRKADSFGELVSSCRAALSEPARA